MSYVTDVYDVMIMCVCVCACVRACVRAYVRGRRLTLNIGSRSRTLAPYVIVVCLSEINVYNNKNYYYYY